MGETIVNEKDKALAHNAIDSVASSYRKSEKDGDLFVEARFNKLCASFESTLTTARREATEAAWRDAIQLLDTAPGCHSAGKWYIDPVGLGQRMNAALEATATKEGNDAQRR